MKDESNILQNSPVTTKCSMDTRNEGSSYYVTVLWNFLFRTLTFVMSIELTAQWYYNFMHEQFVTKAFAYTLPFICVIVLLSDLLIDDEETD
jgi:hypothetical protein